MKNSLMHIASAVLIMCFTANLSPAQQQAPSDISFRTISRDLVITKPGNTNGMSDELRRLNSFNRTLNKINSVIDPTGGSSLYALAYDKIFALCAITSETSTIVLGKMSFSESILATKQTTSQSGFILWHISVPVNIQPTWERFSQSGDQFSKLGLALRLADLKSNAVAQICDLLPNTTFQPANFGGKANFGISVSPSHKWQCVEASSGVSANLWWQWDPKVNVINSGAAGNEAYAIFNRKPDKTGWIGRVPVELLVQAPISLKELVLTIEPFLLLDKEQVLPLASVSSCVFLLE